VAEINDPRLKYVLNTCNLGRVANYRNLLCNHATGDYVINLDGDDYYTDPNFISEAVKLIADDSKVVMVVAKARWEILNQEIVRACRANGIQTNMGLLLLKIPAKLWGAILGRFGKAAKASLH
jgi:cellulose synthase/poly-beta-1,6-N-acetylglucosamine synthase-like glycosyltransferase